MAKKNSFIAPKNELEQFCRRYHIKTLSLFGSALREDYSPESDIDILVEFQPGYKIGFLKMAHIENELSKMFGRKVDLRTPEELSRYFRKEIIESAEIQYAQG